MTSSRYRSDRCQPTWTFVCIANLFFVAVEDRAIVGTAMGGYDGHRGWLYTVAVRPDVRRRGIGSALVRRVESALAGLGCPKIDLVD